MSHVRELATAVLSVLTLTGVSASADAQSQEDGGAETGFHVVREGETLEDITAYYFGTAARWRENYRLNQEFVSDPNMIRPSDELLVLLPERLPREAALLTTTSRTVLDKRLPQREWQEAKPRDLLRPSDALETRERSSTEMLFGDGTRLIVTENSRVIMGEKPTDVAVLDRQRIEIEFGEADLESRPASGADVAVEIVLGDAVLTPRVEEPEKPVRARSRRGADDAGAQIMVYSGESTVAAGGVALEVPEGMGTSVEEGRPPTDPEPLLAAPAAVGPPAGSSWDFGNPLFSWQPVEGARQYLLEICQDPRCTRLDQRHLVAATRWVPAVGLPATDLCWRVTAKAESGLDGYPGEPVCFTVTSSELDRQAPIFADDVERRILVEEALEQKLAEVGATAAAGSPWRTISVEAVDFLGPMLRVGKRLVLGIGAEIRTRPFDTGTGLAEWSRRLDGADVEAASWTSDAWDSGRHTATVWAMDQAGNETVFEPAVFYFDPDPPDVSWGREGAGELGRARGAEAEGTMAARDIPSVDPHRPGPWARITGADQSPLVWTSSSKRWLPMTYGDWQIRSDKPYIVVRARKRPIRFVELGVTVTRTDGLWIQVLDPGCGVEALTYQILVADEPGSSGSREALVIETRDALDNTTRLAWTLVRE